MLYTDTNPKSGSNAISLPGTIYIEPVNGVTPNITLKIDPDSGVDIYQQLDWLSKEPPEEDEWLY